MTYEGDKAFTAVKSDGVLTITTDFLPVNLSGKERLADLSTLFARLERDRDVYVVFQSADQEIWGCHHDANRLNDMSTDAVFHGEAKLFDLQSVFQRGGKSPQATIAKLDGFPCSGSHEFAAVCDKRFAARRNFNSMHMEVGTGILPA